MFKISHLVCCVILLLTPPTLVQAQSGSEKQPLQPQAPVQPLATVDQLQTLKQEIEQLRTTVAAQRLELVQQKGTIEANSKKGDSNNTAWFTLAGAIVAATIAGIVAVINSNRQAAQQRLLKAIEIIMESRSGYQADIRTQNLAVFLDDATKQHLENIKNTFSGPEFTDLNVALAEAMSTKATTAVEVLAIWKAVLKEKNVYNKVQYQQKEQDKSAEPDTTADDGA